MTQTSLKVIGFLSLIRDIALFSESNLSHTIFKSLFQTIFLKSLFCFERKIIIETFYLNLKYQFSRLLSFLSSTGKFVKMLFTINIKDHMNLIFFSFLNSHHHTAALAPLPLSALCLHKASWPFRPFAPSSALLCHQNHFWWIVV